MDPATIDASNPAFRIAVAVLATWRVTHLLSEEDGPFDSVLRLRAKLGTSVAGGLMDCFQCLSLWIAAPLTFLVTVSPWAWIPAWLALSGAACLLERLGGRPEELELRSPNFPENNEHVLRSGQGDPES